MSTDRSPQSTGRSTWNYSEFHAKQDGAGIPATVLRTDFRTSGTLHLSRQIVGTCFMPWFHKVQAVMDMRYKDPFKSHYDYDGDSTAFIFPASADVFALSTFGVPHGSVWSALKRFCWVTATCTSVTFLLSRMSETLTRVPVWCR